MLAPLSVPCQRQLGPTTAWTRSPPSGSHFLRCQASLAFPRALCQWTSLCQSPQRRPPSLQLLARAVLVRSAVAEKPVAEVSGEFGDYDGLLARFRRADLDGNGVIDKEELKLLLETVEDGFACPTTQWIQDKEVDDVMSIYDKTGSGDISFEEFKALANDGILLKGKLGEYADAFSAVDNDGNGSIEMSELGELFRALDHPMEQQELTKVMDEYDKNHQGQIDFGDFLRMFRHKLLDLQDIMKYMSMKAARERERQQQQQQKQAFQPSEASGGEEKVVIVDSEEELDSKLKADAAKLLVLLSTVTWCRPCKTLKRPLEKLADAYSAVSFVTLYGNSNEDLKHVFRDRLGTKVTPTFFFYRGGEIVHKHTGANKTKLENFIRENCTQEEIASLPAMLYPEGA